MLLNQWDQAVTLAQQHNFPQIEGLLAKYANHLLEKEKFLEAIELYRKANHHTEAAKLLTDLALKVRGKAELWLCSAHPAAAQVWFLLEYLSCRHSICPFSFSPSSVHQSAALKVHPMRVKKLYVLAALEVDKFKKRTLEMNSMDAASTMMGTGSGSTRQATATMAANAAQTLAGLMTLEAASMADSKGIDSAWRGAEAYHFWLLAHRQLYAGNVDLAMRTALHLKDYEDILDPQEVYSFLALACFYNKFFAQCSKVSEGGGAPGGPKQGNAATLLPRQILPYSPLAPLAGLHQARVPAQHPRRQAGGVCRPGHVHLSEEPPGRPAVAA